MSVVSALRRNAVALALTLTGIVLLGSALFGHRGLAQVSRLQAEVTAAENRNFAILQENTHLRNELRGLRQDSSRLERAARARLHLVRDGETLYRLEDSATRHDERR